MSAIDGLLSLDDANLALVLGAERAALVLARTDCGPCATYQREIEALLARGALGGIAIGKLVLDQPGASRFKRENAWLSGVRELPYTVLYRRGERVDAFAASRGAYLLERIETAFGPTG